MRLLPPSTHDKCASKVLDDNVDILLLNKKKSEKKNESVV